MKKIMIKTIRIYRKLATFRPAVLFYSDCKFQPTCSEYAEQAIIKHGLLKGLLATSIRISRCNPFSKGGYDLP